MAVKVVQGLIGSPKTEIKSNPLTQVDNQSLTEQSLRQANSAATANTAVSASRSLNNDAVITTLRSSRQTSSGEKIRDPKVAREVADDVAQRIRDNPESVDAHGGLKGASAREHLLS